jgi:hypothetical protein
VRAGKKFKKFVQSSAVMQKKNLALPVGLIAALVMLVIELLPSVRSLPRTVAEILLLTGACNSQAHEYLKRLRHVIPTLVGRPGRPTSAPSPESVILRVTMAVRDYAMTHAGAVCWGGERSVYSDGFRRFIVGLADPGQPGEGMSTADLTFATGVPLGTLKEWLRPKLAIGEDITASGGSPSTSGVDETGALGVQDAAPTCGTQGTDDVNERKPNDIEAPPPPSGSRPVDDPQDTLPVAGRHQTPPAEPTVSTSEQSDTADPSVCVTDRAVHLQLIIRLWKSWSGSFHAFCEMLRTQERLPYGDTFIGDCLHGVGLRYRRRRTPVEAPWSSDTFRTFFPGAQWLGDGTSIAVHWGSQIFIFNVEALLDPATNSTMGFHVSDSEDEEALRLAYEAGLETTAGVPPLAVTLDNKPCNHSPRSVEMLEPTILLRATPGRGQAKAPLEGSFGLFQQAVPPVNLPDESPRETARTVLELVLTAWHRGRNGKPRKRLGGCSPAEAYLHARPTPEEIQEALAAFREEQRRQERARLTREARLDPIRIQLLTQGLTELEIPDPDRRLAIALACYGRDSIVRGLAIFRAKQELGTLPLGADPGRYLGGIIRQLHTRIELERISDLLLEQRVRLHDFTLAPLERVAQQLRSQEPFQALPQAFVDRALQGTFSVDFRFWTQKAVDALEALPANQRAALYRPLCRRIAASFKTDRERRSDLIDRLAQAVAAAA